MWRAGRPRTRRALNRSPPPPSSRARRPRKWRPPRRTCWKRPRSCAGWCRGYGFRRAASGVIPGCGPGVSCPLGPHHLHPPVSPFERSSPPVPPSLRERGNDNTPLECLLQDSLEVFARDVSIPDANHAVPGGFEKCCTGGIIGLLLTRVVHVALEPHDEPLGAAVEVHDEAVEDVLTAKLQAKNAPVSQQRPRVALGRGRCATQLPRPGKPLCVREAPERIHGSKLVRGSRMLRDTEGRMSFPLSRRERGTGGEDLRGGQGVRTCEAARA